MLGELDAFLIAIDMHSKLMPDGTRQVKDPAGAALLNRAYAPLVTAVAESLTRTMRPHTKPTGPGVAIGHVNLDGSPDTLMLAAVMRITQAIAASPNEQPRKHRYRALDVIPADAIQELNSVRAILQGIESPSLPNAADIPHIPRSARIAWDQYQKAFKTAGRGLTDRAAYEEVRRAAELEGDADDLPSVDTWTRHVREYRRITGQNKNASRAGRKAASAVRPDEIEATHLPTHLPRSGRQSG